MQQKWYVLPFLHYSSHMNIKKSRPVHKELGEIRENISYKYDNYLVITTILMLVLECLTFSYILLNSWLVFAVQRFQLQGFANALRPLPQSSELII